MKGVFYDPGGRRLIRVTGIPDRQWMFVTHDPNPGTNQCRRILRELLSIEELFLIDWSDIHEVHLDGFHHGIRSA